VYIIIIIIVQRGLSSSAIEESDLYLFTFMSYPTQKNRSFRRHESIQMTWLGEQIQINFPIASKLIFI